MILVDTSVLIDYFKGKDTPTNRVFSRVLDVGVPYGITGFIYQELLQGARTIGEFKKLKEYLETLPLYELLHGRDSYENAAYMAFLCRRKGVTVRSTIDFLIAETVLENELALLHNDRDFDAIARVVPELKNKFNNMY